ncbi:MAG: sigma factor-like helix-turn-helix DNA-binding protein [Parcubacteria group bacterium]
MAVSKSVKLDDAFYRDVLERVRKYREEQGKLRREKRLAKNEEATRQAHDAEQARLKEDSERRQRAEDEQKRSPSQKQQKKKIGRPKKTKSPPQLHRRSRTISPLTLKKMRQTSILNGEGEEDFLYLKPCTRKECKEGRRPCPFVSCKHHLFLDVNPVTGSIKLNFPHLEVWEMEETCTLDVAERGGVTLEDVGKIMNLTRERVRQMERAGLRVVSLSGLKLKDFNEE